MNAVTRAVKSLSSSCLTSSEAQAFGLPLPLSLVSPINPRLELTRQYPHNKYHFCLLEHYADTATTSVLGLGLVRGYCVRFKNYIGG